jgi:catechol 2,3-dioxygenase-like lactoylglutathione lyase family enzyme
MKIEFVTSVAMITPDPKQSQRLYADTLGISLDGDEYLHSERLAGVKHFGIWPLSQAAEACFGEEQWPGHVPVPQASIEFEVADAAAVEDAGEELVRAGYELLHPVREEPWEQTVVRLLSPEGAIVGISFAPAMH